MLTLTEVKELTRRIFVSDNDESNHLAIPEPPILWKDRLAALEECTLSNHYASCLFDMRVWQAEKLGFLRIGTNDMVKMLMGDVHTETTEGTIRQNYEWVYDHHEDAVSGKDWGGLSTIFKRVIRQGLWYYPPFSKKTIWECQFGKLDYLKRDIPYGVLLRINECKELKLFNCFNVLAPMEAWERKTDIDPIVVASIWEMPPQQDPKKSRQAGQVAHFFLAQW